MRLGLIRHATLLLEFGGLRLLIDPMLDPAGAQPPVPDSPNPQQNPLVELAMPAESLVHGLDAAVVTHTHADHLDATAGRLIPKDLPVVCQPAQVGHIQHGGLKAVPLDADLDLAGVTLSPTGGIHGPEILARELGPVMGVVLAADGEPTIYIAGDTVLCDAVKNAIGAHSPDVIVLNAGAARFIDSEPITMDADQVFAVADAAPDATIIAVHMDAVNHCTLSRTRLRKLIAERGLEGRIIAPDDAQMLEISSA